MQKNGPAGPFYIVAPDGMHSFEDVGCTRASRFWNHYLRQQAIERLLDHRVARADPYLQAGPVEHRDAAAVVVDQAGTLQFL